MKYRVTPGLYALGSPAPGSPLFASANYRLSFNILRRALAGIDAWILVLDTRGISVWCAAGKGTFGTRELVARIKNSNLGAVVSHRRIVVPQLGAPGVKAHEVAAETGFRVLYGPVRVGDIPAYLSAGYSATPQMRTVRFTFADRVVLTPMEIMPSLRHLGWVLLALFAVFGLRREGIIFSDGLSATGPVAVGGLAGILGGAFLTAAALPWIPFRSFALKGLIAGLICVGAVFSLLAAACADSLPLLAGTVIFSLAASSYIGLNFTGCTTFTSISGVKKELRVAVPLYLTACGVAVVCVVMHKLQQWGVV